MTNERQFETRVFWNRYTLGFWGAAVFWLQWVDRRFSFHGGLMFGNGGDFAVIFLTVFLIASAGNVALCLPEYPEKEMKNPVASDCFRDFIYAFILSLPFYALLAIIGLFDRMLIPGISDLLSGVISFFINSIILMLCTVGLDAESLKLWRSHRFIYSSCALAGILTLIASVCIWVSTMARSTL